MAPREYENGELIIQQGDMAVMSPMAGVVLEPIDGMFLLIEGAAQAVKSYWFDAEGKVVYDYRVGKDRLGDYFGEGTFLGAEDRAASIKAVGHTRVIHIDTKVFERLRAGRVEKMLNEHYLKQLEAEHKILADMKRVEECSELYQAIEDFALNNELPMPKLTTTEQLGGFKIAGTAVKAAVKLKRRARRASVEVAERQAAEAANSEVEISEEEQMLREMRESERGGESPTERASREKVAKSLEKNKARGRRASVDLTVDGQLFVPSVDPSGKDAAAPKRYQGRRRSVSEWETAGGDAVDPLKGGSQPSSPVDDPKVELKRSSSKSKKGSSGSSSKSKSKLRSAGHAVIATEKLKSGSGRDGRERSSSKSGGSGSGSKSKAHKTLKTAGQAVIATEKFKKPVRRRRASVSIEEL